MKNASLNKKHLLLVGLNAHAQPLPFLNDPKYVMFAKTLGATFIECSDFQKGKGYFDIQYFIKSLIMADYDDGP